MRPSGGLAGGNSLPSPYSKKFLTFCCLKRKRYLTTLSVQFLTCYFDCVQGQSSPFFQALTPCSNITIPNRGVGSSSGVGRGAKTGHLVAE